MDYVYIIVMKKWVTNYGSLEPFVLLNHVSKHNMIMTTLMNSSKNRTN